MNTPTSDRGELMRRLWLAASVAPTTDLAKLVEQAEGRPLAAPTAPRPANDGPRMVEYAQVPPARAGDAPRTCCLCKRWLCTGGRGPIVQLPDGRWRCGTVLEERCPTRRRRAVGTGAEAR